MPPGVNPGGSFCRNISQLPSRDAHLVTTQTWGVTQRYVYSPYGNIQILNSDWSVTPAGTQPISDYLYQGMTLDVVTGLYYARNRNYSPSLGVWISQDPLQYVNGANRYQFVESRPIETVDPTGEGVEVDGNGAFGKITEIGGTTKFGLFGHDLGAISLDASGTYKVLCTRDAGSNAPSFPKIKPAVHISWWNPIKVGASVALDIGTASATMELSLTIPSYHFLTVSFSGDYDFKIFLRPHLLLEGTLSVEESGTVTGAGALLVIPPLVAGLPEDVPAITIGLALDNVGQFGYIMGVVGARVLAMQ